MLFSFRRVRVTLISYFYVDLYCESMGSFLMWGNLNVFVEILSCIRKEAIVNLSLCWNHLVIILSFFIMTKCSMLLRLVLRMHLYTTRIRIIPLAQKDYYLFFWPTNKVLEFYSLLKHTIIINIPFTFTHTPLLLILLPLDHSSVWNLYPLMNYFDIILTL